MNNFEIPSILLVFLLYTLGDCLQYAPITLNRVDSNQQTFTLANGQRVRVFPIPIQKSRLLHYKARKDGFLYRASKDQWEKRGDERQQAVFEPIPPRNADKHEEFKRNIEKTAPIEKESEVFATPSGYPIKKATETTSAPYLGTNPKAARGDFLIPQVIIDDPIIEDEGSGSGENPSIETLHVTTIQPELGKSEEKLNSSKETGLVVDTLSQEEEGLLPTSMAKGFGAKIKEDRKSRFDFNNHTDTTMIPLVEASRDYLLDRVTESIAHEVTHAPNRHPILKVNGQQIVLPRMKAHEIEKPTEFTEPIRDHLGEEIPHNELHISPNATVAEIKIKILLLNRQLLELQEYVDHHGLHRVKRAAQARGVGPIGDAGLSRGSSGQVTAFVPLPNGDVQKFYLNPAQVGSIANPTASGPQITLGQRGDLFGSDGAVAVAPLSAGVQQLGIGSPFGGLGGLSGGQSFQSFNGYGGGQYQSGGYPVPGNGYGGSGFGQQAGYSGGGNGGQGGQQTGAQASNIPPPILEIKVPPPPKVDIPGCYVNNKGFVCCNKHLENVIDNTMKEIAEKQKEQEAKTGQPACNLQASANLLQKSAEGVFGVSFESLVAPTDFASRTRFMDDLMCKTEQNGKFVIMYATPVPYPISRRR